MNYIVYPKIAQAKEIYSTEMQHVLTTLIKHSRTQLFAHWEIINNKLVCKWQLAE